MHDKEQVLGMEAKPWYDVQMIDVKAQEITPDIVPFAYRGLAGREGQALHGERRVHLGQKGPPLAARPSE